MFETDDINNFLFLVDLIKNSIAFLETKLPYACKRIPQRFPIILGAHGKPFNLHCDHINLMALQFLANLFLGGISDPDLVNHKL
jgi:hypothetical protein